MTDNMKKQIITSLTDEQKNALPLYKEKWLKIAKSTEPLDKEKATQAIELLYKCAGYEKPLIYFSTSPAYSLCIARYLKQEKVKKAPVILDNKAIKEIDNFFNADLENTKVLMGDEKNSFLYGNHSAGWKSFYDVFKNLIKLEGLEDIEGLLKVGEHCGWCLPYKECCIVSERPSVLLLDNINRLHSDTTAAIEFRDGYKCYRVHSIPVPEWVIKHPEKITAELIDAEENIEVRRVILEKYGLDKYLFSGQYEILDKDIDSQGRERILIRKELAGDESIVRVKVFNSSPELDNAKEYRNYVLPVHPQLKPLIQPKESVDENGNIVITQDAKDEARRLTNAGNPQKMTCHNAVASTFGLYGEEYGLKGQTRQGDVLVIMTTGKSKQIPFRES